MTNLETSTLRKSDLQHPSCFPHDVEELEIIETHISWVVLTGRFAYKIKKPVEFEFVDYSTPTKRFQFCEKELELNLVYAPTIYLDVIPISLISNELRFEDDRNVVEYAVKMRQFEQNAILVEQLDQVESQKECVDEFADRLAHFHRNTQRVEDIGEKRWREGNSRAGHIEDSRAPMNSSIGTAEQINGEILDNVRMLSTEWKGTHYSEAISRLLRWTEGECERKKERLDQRHESGFIRRCHGDMHLKNLLWHHKKIIPFDCIEFSEKFQWIDVASDLAFPVMDFAVRGRPELAWRLLSQYLDSTDDYDSLEVLDHYLVYRALVRAKVCWMNPNNHVAGSARKPWEKYLNWALNWIGRNENFLAITHGFSGSGKSTEALRIVERDGAIRIRSDVVRNVGPWGGTGNRYSPENRQRVYDRLLERAVKIVDAGWSAVVDATFLKRGNRDQFYELASTRNIEFRIVACKAPIEHLKKRIAARTNDPSEADVSVIDFQVADCDPLTYTENTFCK